MRAPREDRVVFYAAAVSSFLETSVPLYTRELRVMFSDDAAMLDWLDRVWEPEETGHGELMRDYLARTWPEYRWEDAYSAFLSEYRGYCGPHLLRPSPAREMLSRCVTECQAAMLYRTLASYSDDPEARKRFAGMYGDEVRHYKEFLRAFRRYSAKESLDTLSILRGLVRRRSKAQVEDAGTALRYVNYGWSRELPFAPLGEEGVVQAARECMRPHFPLQSARQMMVKPLEVASPAGRVMARLLGLAISYRAQPVV
ncbi:MAG TPA: ferritin-like domain-containing protein [Usitatibacter sp.]|nr:ferritin-like domain-containing protein [Usitatibacter sp.]